MCFILCRDLFSNSKMPLLKVLESLVVSLCIFLQSAFFPWLPNVLYGTMSVITATMTSGLVETFGHDLPDTLEDVDRLAG